jgi:gamma-glutamylcyclotransferase (GGCT)/AIG2-like uncharacterized protein YtfP
MRIRRRENKWFLRAAQTIPYGRDRELMVMESCSRVFVYGTLQQGEELSHLWPHAPLAVEAAVVTGRLHDLGPYPALVAGTDLVAGELWKLDPEHMAATLAVLDDVEDYGQEGEDDLYVRTIVECRVGDGRVERAFTYLFADPSALVSAPVIAPDSDGLCRWGRGGQSAR